MPRGFRSSFKRTVLKTPSIASRHPVLILKLPSHFQTLHPPFLSIPFKLEVRSLDRSGRFRNWQLSPLQHTPYRHRRHYSHRRHHATLSFMKFTIPKLRWSRVNMANFNDLPVELLLKIARDLPITSFYHLACVCRRFQSIYLPLYLATYGIHDPANFLNLTIQGDARDRDAQCAPDALSALQVAFYITKVKHLRILFEQDHDQVRTLMYQIKRLSRLVGRLENIERVTLVFNKPGQQYNHYGRDIDEALKKWTEAFGGVLNMIVTRSCQSLTIQHGSAMTHCYHFEHLRDPTMDFVPARSVGDSALPPPPPALQSSIPATLPDVMRGTSWRFYRATLNRRDDNVFLVDLSPEAKASTALTSFTIQSPMLLRPPCSQWTISLLEASPITHLTLSDLYLYSDIWAAMMPLIIRSVPGLQDLTIQNCNIPYEVLLDALRECTSLKSLNIDRSMKSPPVPSQSDNPGIGSKVNSFFSRFTPLASRFTPPPPPPIPVLSQLETVQAPSPWVLYLLGIPNSNAFEGLKRLRILPYETSQSVSMMIKKLSLKGLGPEIEVICPEVYGDKGREGSLSGRSFGSGSSGSLTSSSASSLSSSSTSSTRGVFGGKGLGLLGSSSSSSSSSSSLTLAEQMESSKGNVGRGKGKFMAKSMAVEYKIVYDKVEWGFANGQPEGMTADLVEWYRGILDPRV
ncbi:hypothetical protein BDN72DRAFT_860069 [Pluteus cervinus]|uniref:Uncharacterized protein n=1 Tax=Pluteus cervinus TaxID=181527 RepID=A0ACD3AK88_9AGAR|nr:hypothetical protein BDN72DRAFT_860069 [Pluteus cervinus]